MLLQLDIGPDLEGSTIPTVVAFLGPGDLRGGFGRKVFSTVFLPVDIFENDPDVIRTLKYILDQLVGSLVISIEGIIVVPVVLVIDDTGRVLIIPSTGFPFSSETVPRALKSA